MRRRPGGVFRLRVGLAPTLFAVAVLSAACATGALRDAKNAYNEGDFAAARTAAERAGKAGDPQGRLVAARAGTRIVAAGRAGGSPTHDDDLVRIAADLRAATRGYPYGDEWANRELATGVGDWLASADLPELAAVYYRAALEAPGEDLEPGAAAAAEGLVQAGLESLDRWGSVQGEERAVLRDLERATARLLEKTGWPYPPGLADQALRVAWASGDYRSAWEYGAAGWLRAVAEGDGATAGALDARLTDLVFPDWRAAADPALVDAVFAAWARAQLVWKASDR